MVLSRLVKSFAAAGRGLGHVFKSEQNFRIQVVAGALVLVAAIFLPLQTWEMILVILLVFLVLLVEILNTVFEYFSDLLKPRLHHYVYVIKDVMAGAVLLTSLVALVVGVMILYPYLKDLFKW
ncbi:MAG: diacylglycerol kinase [Candidatus Magasanikbacteria bacterium]|nr:diacylglycerol kinase [Candidatus Magasanikbacteria bacterium]